MQTITFNTNRMYSSSGQRIAAAQLDDGSIVFVDIDRGLEYVIAPGAARFTQSSIMGAYDRGGLDWIPNHELVNQLIEAASKAPIAA